MMRAVSLPLLLLLLLLCSSIVCVVADDAVTTDAATAAAEDTTTTQPSPSTSVYEVQDDVLPPQRPVRQWTVRDVEHWMNTTLGYPEYSATLRTHRVDGLTLLALTGADFESYFPVRHPLHVVKFEAHVRQLRQRARRHGHHDDSDDSDNDDAHTSTTRTAASSSSRTVWQYMRQHPVRSWAEGVLALYFPRTAMLTTYVFDRALYRDIVGDGDDDDTAATVMSRRHQNTTSTTTTTTISDGGVWRVWSSTRVRRVVYWAGCVLAPDVYMATLAARTLRGNVAFMLFNMAHLLQQALSEYTFVYAFVRGGAATVFPPGMGLLQRVWLMYSYVLVFPAIAVVVPFVLPYMLQCVLVVVLVVHNTLLLLGWARIVYEDVWCARGDRNSSSNSKDAADKTAAGAATGDDNDGGDTRHTAAAQADKTSKNTTTSTHQQHASATATAASSANDVVD